VRECMRLQTVPEWYEWPVSKSQAYKMLGNGWTVEVIAHILQGLK
jgi:site-specific DNA-cytosine methylase